MTSLLIPNDFAQLHRLKIWRGNLNELKYCAAHIIVHVVFGDGAGDGGDGDGPSWSTFPFLMF